MKTNEKELYEAPLTMSLEIVVGQIICSSSQDVTLELEEMDEDEYNFVI